ncbi:MAG: hypothetical protein AB1486_20405 [Planctomycetota bacterium]
MPNPLCLSLPRGVLWRSQRFSLVFSLVFSGVSAAGDDLPCSKCASTGKVAVPKAVRAGEIEHDVIYCSYLMRHDLQSRGIGWTPCKECRSASKAAAAAEEFARLRREREEWLSGRERVEKEMDVRLEHVETEHFTLSWGVSRIQTEDKRAYDTHGGAHLYASRLEAFYRTFQQVLEITDADCRNTQHTVMVFKTQATLIKAAERYLEVFSDTSAYMAGDPSILVTFLDRGSFPRDQDFHRHLVHHVSHLLCGVYHFKRLADEFGFLHEGLAHWFEMKLFGGADNSCNREQVEEDLGGMHFESLVKRAVAQGKSPALSEFCRKRTYELAGDDHAFAWSITDFLLETSAAKTRDLLARLKRQEPLLESLRALFGWNLFDLQEAWVKFVKQNYSEREDRPLRTKVPEGPPGSPP